MKRISMLFFLLAGWYGASNVQPAAAQVAQQFVGGYPSASWASYGLGRLASPHLPAPHPPEGGGEHYADGWRRLWPGSVAPPPTPAWERGTTIATSFGAPTETEMQRLDSHARGWQAAGADRKYTGPAAPTAPPPAVATGEPTAYTHTRDRGLGFQAARKAAGAFLGSVGRRVKGELGQAWTLTSTIARGAGARREEVARTPSVPAVGPAAVAVEGPVAAERARQLELEHELELEREAVREAIASPRIDELGRVRTSAPRGVSGAGRKDAVTVTTPRPRTGPAAAKVNIESHAAAANADESGSGPPSGLLCDAEAAVVGPSVRSNAETMRDSTDGWCLVPGTDDSGLPAAAAANRTNRKIVVAEAGERLTATVGKPLGLLIWLVLATVHHTTALAVTAVRGLLHLIFGGPGLVAILVGILLPDSDRRIEQLAQLAATVRRRGSALAAAAWNRMRAATTSAPPPRSDRKNPPPTYEAATRADHAGNAVYPLI